MKHQQLRSLTGICREDKTKTLKPFDIRRICGDRIIHSISGRHSPDCPDYSQGYFVHLNRAVSFEISIRQHPDDASMNTEKPSDFSFDNSSVSCRRVHSETNRFPDCISDQLTGFPLVHGTQWHGITVLLEFRRLICYAHQHNILRGQGSEVIYCRKRLRLLHCQTSPAPPAFQSLCPNQMTESETVRS